MWFESQSSEELEIGPDFCYHDTGFTLTGQVSRTIFPPELSQPYSFHFEYGCFVSAQKRTYIRYPSEKLHVSYMRRLQKMVHVVLDSNGLERGVIK